MAGREMLLIRAVLEMRAIELPTPTAAETASLASSAAARLSFSPTSVRCAAAYY